jgi:hypothetical protein
MSSATQDEARKDQTGWKALRLLTVVVESTDSSIPHPLLTIRPRMTIVRAFNPELAELSRASAFLAYSHNPATKIEQTVESLNTNYRFLTPIRRV